MNYNPSYSLAKKIRVKQKRAKKKNMFPNLLNPGRDDPSLVGLNLYKIHDKIRLLCPPKNLTAAAEESEANSNTPEGDEGETILMCPPVVLSMGPVHSVIIIII